LKIQFPFVNLFARVVDSEAAFAGTREVLKWYPTADAKCSEAEARSTNGRTDRRYQVANRNVLELEMLLATW
jgi:hypothetical protein